MVSLPENVNDDRVILPRVMLMPSLPAYAELHCLSNFTFLRGASHPEELVERAHELGYAALAITDECSVAGVVRAHDRREAGESRLEAHHRQPRSGSTTG